MSHYNPKKIYVLLGANGVEFLGKNTMMEFYGEFLDAVKQQHPDATIYVQSILPVTQSKEKKSPDLTNKKIDEYNEALKQLTKEKGLLYVNIAEALKDENGALPEEASPVDGMHFGPSYYKKWFEYLKNHTSTI